MPGAHSGQKTVSDPWNWSYGHLEPSYGCWELSPCLLQQQVFLSAEPSLQPCNIPVSMECFGFQWSALPPSFSSSLSTLPSFSFLISFFSSFPSSPSLSFPLPPLLPSSLSFHFSLPPISLFAPLSFLLHSLFLILCLLSFTLTFPSHFLPTLPLLFLAFLPSIISVFSFFYLS